MKFYMFIVSSAYDSFLSAHVHTDHFLYTFTALYIATLSVPFYIIENIYKIVMNFQTFSTLNLRHGNKTLADFQQNKSLYSVQKSM